MNEIRTRGRVSERHQAFLEERGGGAPGVAPGPQMLAEHFGAIAMATGPRVLAESTGPGAIGTDEEWQPLGPDTVTNGQAATRPRPNVSGRVNAIAVSGATVYVAASNGGVWKSENGGQTWQSTMRAKPHEHGVDWDPEYFMADSLACGAVAQVGVRLYVGTGEGYGFTDSYLGVGALYSDDGGGTWRREPAAQESPALEGQGFYRIAAAPATGGGDEQVFAATKIGLYERTVSGGKGRWVRHELAAGKPDEAATDVVVASRGGRTVFYAAFYGEKSVYRRDSAAGGEWSAVGGDLPGDPFGSGLGGRVSLAVSDGAPDVVYALTDTGAQPHLYRLDARSGGKWKQVSNLPAADGDWNHQGFYNLSIALDPQSPGAGKERIFIGMARVRADASGNRVNPPEGEWSGALFRCDVTVGDSPSLVPTFVGASLHPDIHALEFDPVSKALWVGCDGGVFVKGEAGFVAKNDGLQTMTLERFGQHPTDENVLFCGCQDNGCLRYESSRSSAGSRVWKGIQYNDAGAVLFSSEGGSEEVLVSATDFMFVRLSGADYEDSKPVALPNTWRDDNFVTKKASGIQFYPPLVSSPDNARLVATGGEWVSISETFGGNWKGLSRKPFTEDSSERVRSLVFHDSNKLYAGTRIQASFPDRAAFLGRVLRYVRDTSRNRWSEHPLPDLPYPAPVTGIAIDPADPSGDCIYVTLGHWHDFLFYLPVQPCDRADLDRGVIPGGVRAEFNGQITRSDRSLPIASSAGVRLEPAPRLDGGAAVSAVDRGRRWHLTEPAGGRRFDLRLHEKSGQLAVLLAEVEGLPRAHHLPRVYHYSDAEGWKPRSGPQPKHLFDLNPVQPCERGDLDGGIIPNRLEAEFTTRSLSSPVAGSKVSVVVKGSRWHLIEPPGGRVFDLRARDGRLAVFEETRRLLHVHHSAIVADPVDHAVLYAAADIGVWRSTDSGQTWLPFSEGLPDSAVLDLKLFSGTRRLLRAATHGRGLFQRSV